MRQGEGLHALGGPLDALQGLDHHLHVLGQAGIVADGLADPLQAVLHAVQGVGDLVGDPGHQLADAQELLLLAEFRVRPVNITADRCAEVNRDPQGAGQRGKHGQQIQPSPEPEGPAGKFRSKRGIHSRYSKSMIAPTRHVAAAAIR